MTFILDPGTAPNSYIDAASRRWDLTAGLWKAKDLADLAADAAALAAQTTLYNNEVTLYNATVAADAVALAAEVALYNASQAALAAKTTSGVSTTTFAGTWTNSTSVFSATLATLTAPRTGNGALTAIVRTNSSVGTHGQCRLLVNGGVVKTGTQTGHGTGSGTPEFSCSYQGAFTSGDVVTVQYAGDGATTLNSGELYLTVGAT